MEKPPVSIVLEKLGVPHSVFRHDNPVTSFEQAARERGQRASQVVRSILFRARDEFIWRLSRTTRFHGALHNTKPFACFDGNGG